MPNVIYVIAFIVMTIIYSSFALALLYHLVKFGFLGSFTRIMTALFIVVSVVLIFVAAEAAFTPAVETPALIKGFVEIK